MSTWYKTQKYNAKIEPVEVLRESAKQIVTAETDWRGKPYQARRNKTGGYDNFFPSWTEAHVYLLDRATRQLDYARVELQQAQNQYGNVVGMREP